MVRFQGHGWRAVEGCDQSMATPEGPPWGVDGGGGRQTGRGRGHLEVGHGGGGGVHGGKPQLHNAALLIGGGGAARLGPGLPVGKWEGGNPRTGLVDAAHRWYCCLGKHRLALWGPLRRVPQTGRKYAACEMGHSQPYGKPTILLFKERLS